MIDLKTDGSERAIIERLDAAVLEESMRLRFDQSAARLDQKLVADPGLLLAWETVPLTAYDTKLPDIIRSSWVFILRAGVPTLPERHPNSHQRMVAYRGEGDFQVWDGSAWQSNLLADHTDAPLEKRWISIPVNVWHRSMRPAENLVVVSFQTATELELVEENGDPASAAPTHLRKYSEV
ncbi:MAG TPA: hypothetical protein VI756_30570 [Blastocatellia bacterium]